MAEHVWSVLCDKASTDKDSNLVSLLTVVESLTLQGGAADLAVLEEAQRKAEEIGEEIVIPSNFTLITWFVRTDHEKPEQLLFRVSVKAPNGKVLPDKFEKNVDLRKNDGMRVSLGLPMFPFRGFGRYWLVVEQKKGNRWVKATRLPLFVNPPTEPSQPS